NRRIVIRQEQGLQTDPEPAAPSAGSSFLFTPANEAGPNRRHRENTFDDFNRERLMPHRFSRNGPGSAVADVNGDGRDDVWIGGAQGSPGTIFLQQPDGAFLPSPDSLPFIRDARFE